MARGRAPPPRSRQQDARQSFILDRQRGTYLVRPGNDAPFPHGLARDRTRSCLSFVLGGVRLGTTSIVPVGSSARRLALPCVRAARTAPAGPILELRTRTRGAGPRSEPHPALAPAAH